MVTPSVSLLCVIAYSLFMAFSVEFMFIDFLPLVLVAALNYKKFAAVLRWLLFLELFVFFVVAFILIFHGDYDYAIIIFVRYNTVLLFTLFLFYKNDERYLVSAFANLPIPTKMKALFFMFAKYANILKHDLENLREVLVVRGFFPKTDQKSYETISNMIGMLVIKSFVRAQNLKETLIARDFRGEIYTMEAHKIGIYDVLLVGSLLLAVLF